MSTGRTVKMSGKDRLLWSRQLQQDMEDIKDVKKSETTNEHVVQSNIVKRFREEYPDIRIFAIPNGGSRGDKPESRAIRGSMLKQEGVDRGVPDLFIPELGLFVEVKSAAGKLSPHQIDYIEYLKKVGYHAIMVRSYEEVNDAVQRILNGEEI